MFRSSLKVVMMAEIGGRSMELDRWTMVVPPTRILSRVIIGAVTKPEIFTDPWARSWRRELTASEAYRSAAKKWEGALVLALEGDAELGPEDDRAVFLDLWHGECREARAARGADLERVPFALHGTAAVWKRVLQGDLDPLFALMSGKLKLTRGRVAQLVPFAQAAKEMVQAARRIEATYPRAWEID